MTRLEQVGGEAFRALVAQASGRVSYVRGQYWLDGTWRCCYPLTNPGGSARSQLALATRCVERVVAARARGESAAVRVAKLIASLRAIDARRMLRGPGQPFGALGEIEHDTLDSAVASVFFTARVSLALWTGERFEAEGPTLDAAITTLEARATAAFGPRLRLVESEGVAR
jgi:hypothetical protein